METLEKIKEKLTPSEEEKRRAYGIINEFMELLQSNLKEADVFLGGSFGKDTWLPGDSDVDLFVRFDKKYKGKRISDLLEDALRKIGIKYIKLHGSRDYFKVNYKGYEFEIVPILKIDNPKEYEVITDVSPFHVLYVKKKLEEKPELKGEIRLLKAFMKTIGTYGAESYVQGFSGYACELLIIYYGSFLNLLKEALNWRPKVIIDIEKYYKNKEEVFKKLNKHKLKSPIIIIDPVDPERNASASVSYEKFAKFILNAYIFLKKLEEEKIEYWFTRKKKTKEDFLKKKEKLNVPMALFTVKGKGNNKDVVNTKILKFKEFLEKQLEIYGFKILDSEIIFQEDLEKEGYIAIYYYPKELPEYTLHEGPLPWIHPHFERFLEKWKEYEIKVRSDGRLIALIPRKIRNIKELWEYLKEKYKSSIEDKVEVLNVEFYD